MTDFEKCKADLNKWNFNFTERDYYGDDYEIIGRWIIIERLEDTGLIFDLNGNFVGWE